MKNVLHAVDVLDNKVTVGEKVVVIGGGPVGCDTAYKLVKEEKTVDVIEMLPEILQGVSIFNKFTMMRELSSLRIKIHVNTKLIEVKDNGAIVVTDGEIKFIEANTIVIATGFVGDDSLYVKFEDLANEVYQIGDVIKARKIYDAIQEGFILGKEI